jgi:hypothetical protein
MRRWRNERCGDRDGRSRLPLHRNASVRRISFGAPFFARGAPLFGNSGRFPGAVIRRLDVLVWIAGVTEPGWSSLPAVIKQRVRDPVKCRKSEDIE